MPTARLKYRDAGERRERIVALVQARGYCSVRELSEALDVSIMTIRRDLARLAGGHVVRNSRGGSSGAMAPAGGVDFHVRGQRELVAKREIAAVAASMVTMPMMIGLDAGTTTLEVVRCLPRNLALTVVTQSLPAMVALANRKDTEVMGLGGILHPETQAFAGPATVAALGVVHMAILFLAASGVRDGVMYCGNAFDAETKRAMIASADRTVLLADSTKFATAAPFIVAPVSAVDVCVVDAAVDPSSADEVRAMGVEVVLAYPGLRDESDAAVSVEVEGV